jgi:hypothetical protein
MNPKELHELYAPLWERVPELRPHFNIDGHPDSDILWLGLAKEGWWGWMLNTEDYPPDGEDEGAISAAALCRVAVEDWLRNTTKQLTIFETGLQDDEWKEIVTTAGSWVTNAPDAANPLAQECAGPTIHHAIVAAALAVHAANPSAPPPPAQPQQPNGSAPPPNQSPAPHTRP